MKLLLFFNFLLILVQNCFSQTGWIRQYGTVLPSLRTVQFVNPSTGWIVGGGGGIQKSTNGGVNWFIQNSNTTVILYDVFFTSINTGYVIGENGLLIKSTNGGENWIIQNSGTTSTLRSQTFINENTGYVVGFNGAFLKSTNGGTNWYSLNLGDSIRVEPYDIQFINENTGWVSGKNINTNNIKLFKTTDAGNNWTSLYDFGSSDLVYSFFFITENNGFLALSYGAVAITGILKTEDGGLSWNTSNIAFGSHAVIFFKGLNKGWYVGASNQIYHTSNSGNNWIRQPIEPLPLIDFSSCYFIDSLTGWTVGGSLFSTTTGGVLTGFSNTAAEIPDKYSLSQNYPNPFNPETIINYELGIRNFVSLKVYNALGLEVETLVYENKPAGSYQIEFDGSNYPSGVYLYRLEIDGNIIDTKRMVLLK